MSRSWGCRAVGWWRQWRDWVAAGCGCAPLDRCGPLLLPRRPAARALAPPCRRRRRRPRLGAPRSTPPLPLAKAGRKPPRLAFPEDELIEAYYRRHPEVGAGRARAALRSPARRRSRTGKPPSRARSLARPAPARALTSHRAPATRARPPQARLEPLDLSSFEPPAGRRFALRQLALVQDQGMTKSAAAAVVSAAAGPLLLLPPPPLLLLLLPLLLRLSSLPVGCHLAGHASRL